MRPTCCTLANSASRSRERRDGQMLLSDVAADDQHAADTALVVDRTIAVGPVDLFGADHAG